MPHNWFWFKKDFTTSPGVAGTCPDVADMALVTHHESNWSYSRPNIMSHLQIWATSIWLTLKIDLSIIVDSWPIMLEYIDDWVFKLSCELICRLVELKHFCEFLLSRRVLVGVCSGHSFGTSRTIPKTFNNVLRNLSILQLFNTVKN